MVATAGRPESTDVPSGELACAPIADAGVPIEVRDQVGDLYMTRCGWSTSRLRGRNESWPPISFSVEGHRHIRRPHIVVVVNVIPLALMVLKGPGQEGATLPGASAPYRS